ncbi:Oligopeptide transport system permease protein OppB (TC 3.A.1.5.1) [Caballeronia glathei]|jgi:oligopeptide transport system ATP-binding protein|uniref:Oligopeptide transporter ATP-binding component n=1 Tax=Caballeronia glathei TaxID=60547 RepID=A0A069PS99_9BURK|nr:MULTISPECIES: oligopeptide/dipeptide ABC transporter ATP-binding protein [Burkholderiaceae]KDR43490.1 oligopeptide transporter ATP-binding component [Caballeronia glathei]TCK39096.1 oligopeptide transport system ATP-binding protein [Paraburkholderia sp. BL8N3]CDY76223.1 Oligopeptide transport system permease protein OppB (TC 3.A.1.5.1) [Caballeronia glathei]
MSLLKVDHLAVEFQTPDAAVRAVNGVSFELEEGSTLGIVGESGSGKSQSVLAMLGLLARNGRASGTALYQGENLLTMPPKALNRIRGNRLSMIFQDPMTSLNPYLTIERQMTEVLELHKNMTRRAAKKRAIGMLEAVRIPEAAHRIDQYPHELSGGMRQRVMIAMALLCEPQVLFADEPTTALDVTVQAQILQLLRNLQHDFGTAIVLITHDLGVVAGLCEKVMVMYGGRVMEHCSAADLFARPSHPYTIGLLRALPRLDEEGAALRGIPGNPPNMAHPPAGCPFQERCVDANAQCAERMPALDPLNGDATWLRACHRPVEQMKSLHEEPSHV